MKKLFTLVLTIILLITTLIPTACATSVGSGFEVHFIDVGQADAALVLCDGRAMLIDGGNVGDSSKLYTYLINHNITHLDYVIGTHAHEDHIGGIAGALNYASVGVAYCPVTSYSSDAFTNFAKAVKRHGTSITVPSANTSFMLGSAACEILAVNTDSDVNNSSIVLLITYDETSFMFTGDAEREVEQAILDRGEIVSSTVLKVGHHGSDTSTSYVWLRAVMPKYAVISVGNDNSYGHPTEEVLSRLRDADVTTFRTDMQGDIICVSDGKTVSFTVAKNADADTFGGIGSNSTQNASTLVTTSTVLRRGAKGAEVEALQTRLKELGYYTGSVDGDFGNNTQNAVKAFQKQNGLTADGVVGAQTANMLNSSSAVVASVEKESNTSNSKVYTYVYNKNTKKFHYSSCSSAKSIKESNRGTFKGTREEMIKKGYSPCKNCNP